MGKHEKYTNCLGLAGIYFKYIPQVIEKKFTTEPDTLLKYFPKDISGRQLPALTRIDPHLTLTLFITESERKITIFRYFNDIVQGKLRFTDMLPTNFRKQNTGDNQEIDISETDDEQENASKEEITIKGEKSLNELKQLIDDCKLNRAAKGNFKLHLQNIKNYVNTLKNSEINQIAV